jgi:hypothetical protein
LNVRIEHIAAVTLALCFSAPVWADDTTAAVATKISEARKENALQTMNYSWTRRTEVKVKGETKSLKTELVRYTADGELQKTPMSESQAKKPKGVRGKVASKKAGEMKDWMMELGELLKAYSLPTAGNLMDFLDKAAIVPDGGGHKLVAENVVVQGDTMTMHVDSTNNLTRTEVSTTHDGSAVQLTTDHDATPDGLNYVARTNIVVPDKQVEMTVENFSYTKER